MRFVAGLIVVLYCATVYAAVIIGPYDGVRFNDVTLPSSDRDGTLRYDTTSEKLKIWNDTATDWLNVGIDWYEPVTATLTPDTNNLYDLGTSSAHFKDVHAKRLISSDGIVVEGASIQLIDGTEGTSGECFVSIDTNGTGEWTLCPGGGDTWEDPVTATLTPNADNTFDIGTSTVQFKDLFLDGSIILPSVTLTENSGDLEIGAADITLTGSTQIKNLVDPTLAQDAATKTYVDTGDSVVTENSVKLTHVAALISNSGTPTIVIDYNNGTSWISSLTDIAVGRTTVNYASGVFSSTATCNCTISEPSTRHSCNVTGISAGSITIRTYNASDVLADVGFEIKCTGPN